MLILSFCFPYAIIIIRANIICGLKCRNTEIGRVLSCQPIPDIRGWMVGYTWEGQQSIKQLTQRHRRPFTLTFTPAIFGLSLEVIVSVLVLFFLTQRNILVLLLGSTPPSSPHVTVHLPVSHTYSSDCPRRHSMYGRPILGALDFLCSLQVSGYEQREKQQQKAKLEKNHSEGLMWEQWSVDTTC